MDKQLALMKRYQKDENTIAYVHNDEVVLIKRKGNALYEILLDPATESVLSTRTLASSEMTLQQFTDMKKELTDTTIEDFNSEQRHTYRNISYEAVAYMSDLGEPSVEDEYIEKLNGVHKENDLQRVYALLNKANLTETQKRRFIKHIYHKKSTRRIANEEGISQSTVMNSLIAAKRKLKMFCEHFQK